VRSVASSEEFSKKTSSRTSRRVRSI